MISDRRTLTRTRCAMLVVGLAIATALALTVPGCSSGSDGGTTAIGGSTTIPRSASPSSTSAGSTGPSGPSGTASGSTRPSGSVAEPRRTSPFNADAGPETSGEVEGYPVLVSVRQGEHEGYRRYVFTFRHADPEGHQPWRQYARPAWDVRYVPASQAVKDGSGEPVANAGARAHLRIRFQADMHYADGRSSLEQSVGDEPPDLVFGGDYENRVAWFYGAAKEEPFRVIWVGDGRVAVDIVR